MNDYSEYAVEDFVVDEDFQQHVKHPTAESIHFWETWLNDNSHKAEEVSKARLIILSMDFKRTPEREIPTDLLFRRIQVSIHEAGERETIQKAHRFWSSYRRMAAVFLGLIIATASLYLMINDRSVIYATVYGEVKRLTLPDGSTMILNANSSVEFDKEWARGDLREVSLKGEAFFEVVHTKHHDRFVVKTGQLNVEVLGTEFNVQSRRTRTRVVLNSGKVKISRNGSDNEVLYMTPGELVEVNEGSEKAQKSKVNPAEFSSWTDGQLIFRATPLVEVAQTLVDRFGWKVTFENEEIKNFQFTGKVSTQSMDEIKVLLYTLSESFDIEVVQTESQLIFRNPK